MFKIVFTPLLVMLILSNVSHAANKSKPNIVVILVDDLGYGDLSCQGGTDIRTPHIDKLFEKGMTFNRPVYFMRREGHYYGGLCYYAIRDGQYKLVQNIPPEPI